VLERNNLNHSTYVVGKMDNEELPNLCYSPNFMATDQIRMIWMGYVACMEEMKNAYRI
jgi:hypothetical protein